MQAKTTYQTIALYAGYTNYLLNAPPTNDNIPKELIRHKGMIGIVPTIISKTIIPIIAEYIKYRRNLGFAAMPVISDDLPIHPLFYWATEMEPLFFRSTDKMIDHDKKKFTEDTIEKAKEELDEAKFILSYIDGKITNKSVDEDIAALKIDLKNARVINGDASSIQYEIDKLEKSRNEAVALINEFGEDKFRLAKEAREEVVAKTAQMNEYKQFVRTRSTLNDKEYIEIDPLTIDEIKKLLTTDAAQYINIVYRNIRKLTPTPLPESVLDSDIEIDLNIAPFDNLSMSMTSTSLMISKFTIDRDQLKDKLTAAQRKVASNNNSYNERKYMDLLDKWRKIPSKPIIGLLNDHKHIMSVLRQVSNDQDAHSVARKAGHKFDSLAKLGDFDMEDVMLLILRKYHEVYYMAISNRIDKSKNNSAGVNVDGSQETYTLYANY